LGILRPDVEPNVSLRSSFHVQGVIPVTIRDIETKFTALMGNVQTMVTQALDQQTAQLRAASILPTPAGAQRSGTFLPFDWNDGTLGHSVPRGWHWPAGLTVAQMWDLWNFGDTQIQAYRGIRTEDLEVKELMMYNRAAVAMRCVKKIVEGTPGLLPAGVTKVSQLARVASDAVLDKALTALWPRLYNGGNENMARKCELKYSTLYNRLLSSKIPEMEGMVRSRKRKHSDGSV